jgi:hypothetical protein
MIAHSIRLFIARNITSRGISDTYEPGALTISALDLARFADELRTCCSGDSIDMAETVAGDLADMADEHDPDEMMPSPWMLDRLERALRRP